MNKQSRILITYIIILSVVKSFAQSPFRLQAYEKALLNPELLSERWQAQWIKTLDTNNEYGVYHFRKVITIDVVPEHFVVNVSADNRYKLYVNEKLVSLGPAEGNIENWRFETVDISSFLKPGKNVLAAEVWNFAQYRPVAIISNGKCGIVIQGNSKIEDCVNTNDSWLCIKDKSYSPLECPKEICNYAIGSGELFNANFYPWGWKSIDYDDKEWKHAVNIANGCAKGGIDYPDWQLVPRSIPQMESKEVHFSNNTKDIIIPAHTEKTIYFDNKEITLGYPQLHYSGGKGAEIFLGYAEALYKDQYFKGNRNEIEGKHFQGYSDEIISDGGEERIYVPLMWRTWRFIAITVKTVDEPLKIDDIYGISSMYPLKLESTFNAPGHEDLSKMLEIGWRTTRLCSHETFMSDAYYEQLQYFGDARIQALVTMFNTRDNLLIRNLLEQGRESMTSEGITMSRYPSRLHQFIPPYSLIWLCTAHDYWMYRGDETYLKSLLPAFHIVLEWFKQYKAEDNTLRNVPFWKFIDWANFSWGEVVADEKGRSAYLDILYMMSLENVGEMEEAFGSKSRAEEYKLEAKEIKETFKKLYWDDNSLMFADNPDKKLFSQHINSLAIIAGIIKGKEASDLLKRIVDNKDINQCTIYFRYYLQQAMKKSGNGDLLLDRLNILRDQMALGLTTWAEQPEPSRSDCHPWGASPNIELYRIVLGIDSDAPGFKKVVIEPALGSLKEVSGSIPHPLGTIEVSYKVKNKESINASITLPKGVDGIFKWNKKEYKLHSGKQDINI